MPPFVLGIGEDHPRVCGEKKQKRKYGRRRRGSPPRVRGEADPRSNPYEMYGITPACAGRSWIALSRCCRIWDHPRVCGEKGRN